MNRHASGGENITSTDYITLIQPKFNNLEQTD